MLSMSRYAAVLLLAIHLFSFTSVNAATVKCSAMLMQSYDFGVEVTCDYGRNEVCTTGAEQCHFRGTNLGQNPKAVAYKDCQMADSRSNPYGPRIPMSDITAYQWMGYGIVINSVKGKDTNVLCKSSGSAMVECTC